MGKTITADELTGLLHPKGVASFEEKIKSMITEIIKSWMDSSRRSISYDEEENKRVITSQTNRLCDFFKHYGIIDMDDAAMQVIRNYIADKLWERTNLCGNRKDMVRNLNVVTDSLRYTIRKSLEGKNISAF